MTGYILKLLPFAVLLSGCAINVEDFDSGGPISSASMIGCMQKPMNHQPIISKRTPMVAVSENVVTCIGNENELSEKNIDRSMLLTKKKKVKATQKANPSDKFQKELQDAADKKEFENIEKVVLKEVN